MKMFNSTEMLFASRAADLIVNACTLSDRPVVLLPALYCSEIATALKAAGKNVQCFDLTPELGADSTDLVARCSEDVGAVINLHPFGLYRPLPPGLLPSWVGLIEDGCHALRTAHFHSGFGTQAMLSVFSMRKEYQWPDGGLATGPWYAKLTAISKPNHRVAQQWRLMQLESEAERGAYITELAKTALGNYLPAKTQGEVLTFLPLKSVQRDKTIERLRTAGFQAWRWLETIPGMEEFIVANQINEHLLLVPLPDADNISRLGKFIEKEPLLEWW